MQPSRPNSTPVANAASIVFWIGGAGAVILAAGTWFASKALFRLGPVALVAIVAAALGAGLVIAAAILSAFAPARIADDVDNVSQSLEAIARGDLSRDFGQLPTGPMHRVASSLQRVLTQLRPTLGTARGAARESAQRAEELATQCSTAHVASQRSAEQGASVAEQATLASDQARSLQGELANLVSGVARVESALRARSDHGARITTVTGSATADLVDASTSLDELTTRFTAASTELAGLGRAVGDVQEFVALVRKMARQSKLLSLNAAMEAARAGEQGNGFGVVAAEVRRLARSSSEAADRTEKLLRDLLHRAGVAQEASRDTLGLARNTREAVERSRALMVELQGEVAQGTAGAPESPAAALNAAAARLEQLCNGLTTLAQSSRDARVAGSAQVARVQDLIAAAHSLGRSAARTATALQDLKVDVVSATVVPADEDAGTTGVLPRPASA